MKRPRAALPLLGIPLFGLPAFGQEPPSAPPELERRLEEVRAESEANYQTLLEEIDAWKRSAPAQSNAWYDRLTLGGYGEIHYNSVNVDGGEQIDLHRFVGYLGYRFEDWIQLHSEIELEHAFVEEGNGEIAIEQLHVDFLLRTGFNVRAGRFLTPLGIVNKTHEPTTFHGVERSLFDTYVIPTTWSSDGIGVFGSPCENWKYELYLGSSLDGTGFDPINGIRGGRQEERPGLSEPAVSGRVDWFPGHFEGELRLGGSYFVGGLDNGNEGQNPGVDGNLQVYSADAQYSAGRWDFRAVYALETISHANDLGSGVASEIDGYSLEAARHVMPEAWKSGKLEKADLVAFLRYDAIDTQKELPGGTVRDPAGEREEITFGLSFFPTTGLVIKADYQIRDDEASGLPERFNLGIGWSF
jgi:hypothetical protein